MKGNKNNVVEPKLVTPNKEESQVTITRTYGHGDASNSSIYSIKMYQEEQRWKHQKRAQHRGGGRGRGRGGRGRDQSLSESRTDALSNISISRTTLTERIPNDAI